MSTALTETERLKLGHLELIIEDGMEVFVQVGAALAQIREQRLFRSEFETFEAYCQDRWGWSSSRARQLIGASEVAAGIESVTPGNGPKVERHARELVSVPDDKRADVWAQAIEESGGKPTAKDIRRAATPFKKHRRARAGQVAPETDDVEAPLEAPRRFAEWCGRNTPRDVAERLDLDEHAKARDLVRKLDDWTGGFLNALATAKRRKSG